MKQRLDGTRMANKSLKIDMEKMRNDAVAKLNEAERYIPNISADHTEMMFSRRPERSLSVTPNIIRKLWRT